MQINMLCNSAKSSFAVGMDNNFVTHLIFFLSKKNAGVCQLYTTYVLRYAIISQTKTLQEKQMLQALKFNNFWTFLHDMRIFTV